MKPDQDRTIVQLLAFQPRVSRTMDVFLLRLAETLAERGWKTVHVFSGDPPEAFRARLEAIGSPYLRADFPIDWHRAQALAPLLRPLNLHVIQTTFMSFFSPSLWWLKRAIGAKHWVVADHTSGRCSPRRGLKGAAARLQAAAAARFIDRVVAVSDFVARRDVEQHMLPRRIVQTIYNGVDTRRFHPAERRPDGDRPPTIVFVGQLIPEKGVDLLIEATRRLSQGAERPPALKIAGAGRERSTLENLAARALPGQVEFLGQVEDVPALLASADLAVFPSRWDEAFGLVVAEAMACGTPVITSDAGGIPEVIGPDGQAGLIFRTGSVDDLERQMRIVVADPTLRARMGQAARDRVERAFSIDRMVDGYTQLLLSL